MAIDTGAAKSSSRAARILAEFLTGEKARERRIAVGVIVLTALRFALGAVLPLSFDEAYYWLWSKHLALGYYDHPPAIAYAIRAGTLVFGDTPFGVRVAPLLGSVLASWAVWRAAQILLSDSARAALACLLFNLTLMVAAETMAATPDALALAAASLVLFALANLLASNDGRWWLGVGAFGGLCLLSKYTGFFLGAGVLVWLFATSEGRKWIVTPWPWLGGALAILVFAPVIVWNAAHDWLSFRFQFGRVASGGLTLRYFGEFFLAQAALASPFILILGVAGFARGSRLTGRLALAAALMWPAVIYFLVHATHDRVQGNWPSFLYPAFAVLATYAATETWSGRFARPLVRASRVLAAPVAALILVIVYAQAFFDIIPMRDPISRLTAFGFPEVAQQVARIALEKNARAIVTTNYPDTAWLAFYLRPKMPIVQLNETYRWLSAPQAQASLAQAPLLYITAQKRLPEAIRRFADIRPLATIVRRRHGVAIETYEIYEASGWRGGDLGRQP